MNAPAFTQIDSTPWPSGYPEAIAVTRVQPELFSRAFGLTFSEGFDNLGEYTAATIRLRSGRMLGLLRHVGDPGPGTEVYADANDEFVGALREFLDAFDLSAEDLSWMRDEISAGQLRLAQAQAHA
jgi:hypothetical protein